MKRELKFRAWDKDNSKMLNNIYEIWRLDNKAFNEPSEHNNLRLAWANEKGHGYWRDIIPSQVELMQFTGLQDKDGNEIYEGDILDDNWQIHFYRGMFVAVRCGLIPNMDNSYQIFWVVENEHCVIGNIYENAELLNVQPIKEPMCGDGG